MAICGLYKRRFGKGLPAPKRVRKKKESREKKTCADGTISLAILKKLRPLMVGTDHERPLEFNVVFAVCWFDIAPSVVKCTSVYMGNWRFSSNPMDGQ